jgi:heterodisulfide reductase subunit C
MENTMKMKFEFDMEPKEVVALFKAIKTNNSEETELKKEFLHVSERIEEMRQDVAINKKLIENRENLEEFLELHQRSMASQMEVLIKNVAKSIEDK